MNMSDDDIPYFPPVSEFLNLTEAQRISLQDQADAMIKDRAPEAAGAVEKAAVLANELARLIPNHPETAITMIEGLHEVLSVISALAESQIKRRGE